MADKLSVPTRDELVAKYERDYQLINEGALVGPDTSPGQDARVHADTLLPIYAEAVRSGEEADLDNRSLEEVIQDAVDLGLPGQLPASGSSGAVFISTATGGATFTPGLECRDPNSKVRYVCQVNGTRTDGAQVALLAKDVGPQTNAPPGTILHWTSPPIGLNYRCTVVEQADGSGLSGGAEAESVEDIRVRVRDAQGNPAAAGNVHHYRRAILGTKSVAPQAAWGYPCSNGAATISCVFTKRPSAIGRSRAPSEADVAAVRAACAAVMNADDTVYFPELVEDPVTLVLAIRWQRTQRARWTDAVTWPPYVAGDTNKYTVLASPAPTATTFSITTAASSYVAPQVGQTIALWDDANNTFRAKRILTVGAPGGAVWNIACDLSNGASDASYAPIAGQVVSPWSDSINSVVENILAYFDAMGPGEMIATPFDTGGRRQKREPNDLITYPSILTGRILTPLYRLSQIDDVRVLEPELPRTTRVGLPGTLVYLMTIGDLAVYPL